MRGSVSGEFKELCYTRRIVVFDRVPYKVLQGMAESCLKEPTVYISEATEVGDVSTGYILGTSSGYIVNKQTKINKISL